VRRHCGTSTLLLLALVAGCAKGDLGASDGGGLPTGDPDAMEEPSNPRADASTQPLPDAAPPPDAMPVSSIDASPPPDANEGPCTPTVINLLTNAGFDSGPGGGWQEVSGANPPFAIVTHQDGLPLAPQTAPFAAWMGGYLASASVAGIDSLHQSVTVPADATNLELGGFRAIASAELSGEFDTLRVTIRNTSNAVLESLNDPAAPCTFKDCTWSNEDETTGFAGFTLTPAGNYAGQTIRVHLESDVDNSLNTNFFLDSFAVRVTVCL
jgi:hypothetical protein